MNRPKSTVSAFLAATAMLGGGFGGFNLPSRFRPSAADMMHDPDRPKTDKDLANIAAAQAKRKRKAAKRQDSPEFLVLLDPTTCYIMARDGQLGIVYNWSFPNHPWSVRIYEDALLAVVMDSESLADAIDFADHVVLERYGSVDDAIDAAIRSLQPRPKRPRVDIEIFNTIADVYKTYHHWRETT